MNRTQRKSGGGGGNVGGNTPNNKNAAGDYANKSNAQSSGVKAQVEPVLKAHKLANKTPVNGSAVISDRKQKTKLSLKGKQVAASGNGSEQRPIRLQRGDTRLKTIKEEQDVRTMNPQQLQEFSKKTIGKLAKILSLIQKVLNEEDDVPH